MKEIYGVKAWKLLLEVVKAVKVVIGNAIKLLKLLLKVVEVVIESG